MKPLRVAAIWPDYDRPGKIYWYLHYSLHGALDRLPGCELMPVHMHAVQASRRALAGADIILLPQWRRWLRKLARLEEPALLRWIKDLGRPTAMLDDDGCLLPMAAPVYRDVGYVFCRGEQLDGMWPPDKGAWLPWCVDTNRFTPNYCGRGAVMIGGFNLKVHPLRCRLRRRVRRDPSIWCGQLEGQAYIQALQGAMAAVATNREGLSNVARAKCLEIAACGTLLVCDRGDWLERYYPLELIHLFHSERDFGRVLRRALADPCAARLRQQELRGITEARHSATRQAGLVLEALQHIAARGSPPKDLLYRLQHPLERLSR